MIWSIAENPGKLRLRHGDLVELVRDGEVAAAAPASSLSAVVVEHPQTSFTTAAVVALAVQAGPLILCGRDHLPAAIVQPLAGHCLGTSRLHAQIALRRPRAKQLWRQLVRAKIRAQALALAEGSPARSKLLDLATTVRSGDVTNVEAQAAKIYWRHWLAAPFRRAAASDGLNGLLNYGYAILRAALAVAIVAAGLHPSLGLHHRRRSNHFCLADDLIEPFRPAVDRAVRYIDREGGPPAVTAHTRPRLLAALQSSTACGDWQGPLIESLPRLVGSLVACCEGRAQRLEIPRVTEQA